MSGAAGLMRLALAGLLSLLPLAAQALPPVMHYRAGGDCPPIFLFSNGFGGNRMAYHGVAHAAVRAGFDTWVIEHAESGPAAWRKVNRAENRNRAIWDAIMDPAWNQAHLDRIGEVLDHVKGLRPCTPPMVVLGGYSVGAQVAMVEAGAATGFDVSGTDRFDAYVALSPPGLSPQFPPPAWAGIGKPVLVVTGTHDGLPYRQWKRRLAAFETLPEDGTKWFVLVRDASHHAISGTGTGDAPRAVHAVTEAFLWGLREGDIDLTSKENIEVWER